MIKYINELKKEDLSGKKVLLRVDFNVTANDFKIKAHRETIDYLSGAGAKILLVSHHDNLESFLPMTEKLGIVLGQTISLVPHSEFSNLDLLFQTSQILLLDNIRQDPREEENNEELAKEVSRGFDFFINDAFAVSHRNHALVTSITKFLPSYAGFLVKKEIENLNLAIKAPAKGKILVLGGAKISTKWPVIENFLDKAERILIGGALANDFWQAKGVKIGVSLVDDTVVSDQLGNGVSKLILPTDILILKGWTLDRVKELIAQGPAVLDNLKVESIVSEVKNLASDEAIVDIGPQSAQNFAEIIKNAEMVIWNGPMGISEAEKFVKGTEIIAKAVAEAPQSIIGGGDTITVAAKLNLLDKFSYVSTGGGAMLEFLAGNRLPGLEALHYYE